MKTLEQFMAEQRSAVIHEFVHEMGSCLIATTEQKLREHCLIYGWTLSPLAGTSQKSVVVVRKRSGSFPELWVRRDYGSYRKAFQKYLRLFHGHVGTLPRSLQVDHLQARHRFKQEHEKYFIRLHLLDQNLNAAYGAGFERSFNDFERESEPRGGMHMDWMTFLKVYGVIPPSKRATPEIWRQWAMTTANAVNQEGFALPSLLQESILSVLRLGFTEYYSGSRFESVVIDADELKDKQELAPPILWEGPSYIYELIAQGDGKGIVIVRSEDDSEGSPLPTRADLYQNYPGDFSWGYAGSGPNFLTRSLLAHHFSRDDFSSDHINKLLEGLIAKLPCRTGIGPLRITSEMIQSHCT